MKIMDKLDRHAGLMGRMAETVGADVGSALALGALSGEQLRGSVLRCTTCGATRVCEEWLERHEGDCSEPVPEFCLNAALLERLKD